MLFGRKTASEAAQEAAAEPMIPERPAPGRSMPPPAEFKRLGQILIEEGLITTGQLEKAMEEQSRTGAFLGQILVAQGAVSQSAVSSCLVKQCKIPHLSLLDYDISGEVLALIPETVCRKYHLLPIDKLGRILTVAMVDPLDTEALEVIRQHCGDLKIKPILCNWEHYDSVSARLWGKDSSGKGTQKSVTAESLGLGRVVAKTTDPTPTPLPPSGTAPAPSLSDSQLNLKPAPAPALSDSQLNLRAASAGASAQELTAAIRGAMSEAVQALAARAPQPSAGPDMNALGELLRQSVQEAVTAAAREMRPVTVPVEQGAAQAAAPDLRELGALLKQSVQEAVSAVAQEMRQAPQPTAPPAANAAPQITPEKMAAVIQESVGGAMQEALAVMVTQFKALAPRRDDSQGEALAVAVRDSVREALQATLAAQQEQGSQLAQIAEATLQSVRQTTQLFESAGVARQNENDLRSPQARHASVSSFRGGVSGTMDTDGKVVEALENNRPAETMTFDTFVPGNVNAFTFKVSQQIATRPGGEFNPLFLFGHVGAGKTHLISAIGNHVLHTNPNARVGYVSASHFARRLKDAVAENALDAFRENYAHWDVLILDDIQFLAGRVEAQEEFFHIFNALLQQGRQIIIASDKSPDRLGLLEQRLISRFASGIVTELKAPEWEARMAILKQLVNVSGAKVPEPILSLIAMRVTDDVRKMTGSLRKVIAYAQLGGKDLSVEMAEDILSHLGAEAAA